MSDSPKSLQFIGLGLISLLLGILFDRFFITRMPGLSWPIFIMIMLGGLTIIIRWWSKPVDRETLLIIGPLLFCAGMLAIYDSPELTALNLVACLVLALILVAHLTRKSFICFTASEYIHLVLLPFAFVPNFFRALTDMLTVRFHLKNPKVGPVVKGILMAIPALILFGALFASADLVFKKYLTASLRIQLNPEAVMHTGLSLLIAAIFVGAFSLIVRQNRQSETAEQPATGRHIGVMEINVMLALINALLLAFVAIQAVYLFGGQSNITAQGFTYAQYARRGFFELIAAALFSGLIIWTAEQSVTRHQPSSRSFRWLASLMIILVLGIMGSAFFRLNLYEEAYGFTAARFFSHAFTIWLGLAFVLLLIKIHLRQSEPVFLRWVYGAVIVFLVVINLINPDAFTARQNIALFERIGKIDSYYLSRLSTDAVPEKLRALDLKDPVAAGVTGRDLYWKRDDLNQPMYKSWLSWNWSRYRARKLIERNISRLDPLKDYQIPISLRQ